MQLFLMLLCLVLGISKDDWRSMDADVKMGEYNY